MIEEHRFSHQTAERSPTLILSELSSVNFYIHRISIRYSEDGGMQVSIFRRLHVELLQEKPKIDEGPPRPEFLPKTTKPNIEKVTVDVGSNVAAAPIKPDAVVDGGDGGGSPNGTPQHGSGKPGYSIGGNPVVGYNGGGGGGDGGASEGGGDGGGVGKGGDYGGSGEGGGGGGSGGGKGSW
jgi:hypothetical protein